VALTVTEKSGLHVPHAWASRSAHRRICWLFSRACGPVGARHGWVATGWRNRAGVLN